MSHRIARKHWMWMMLLAVATLVATMAWAAQTPAPAQTKALQPAPAQTYNCPYVQNGNTPMRAQGKMMHRGMTMHRGMYGAQGMMAMHQEMTQKLQAMDQKLDGLVTTMNKARGNAKMAAMAAVINELVAQRQEMRKMVSNFHPMMGRGMYHSRGMGMGREMGRGMRPGMGKMGAGGEPNWKNCPMRNQAPQAKDTPPATKTPDKSNPPQN